MQNSEKKLYKQLFDKAFVDVPTVKDRIFHRHFMEHGCKNEVLNEHFPEWESTTLEKAGITAMLAITDVDYSFAKIADDLHELHKKLVDIISIAKEIEHPNNPLVLTGMVTHAKTVGNLIRLFDWLKAYGPVENKFYPKKKE